MSEAKKTTAKYTKDKFLKAEAYKEKRDLVNALLEDGKSYMKADVDKLISSYLKREVK